MARDLVYGTAPFLRGSRGLNWFVTVWILAALPLVGAATYFFGLRVVALLALTIAVSGVCDFLFARLRKEPLRLDFIVFGILFALVMPPGIPYWIAAVTVAFGTVFGKQLFGGSGRYIFNPVILGVCFLFLAYPSVIGTSWIFPGTEGWGRLLQYVDGNNADAVASATPLALAKQGSLWPLLDMAIGKTPGCAGETSAFAVILGGLVLLVTRAVDVRIVLSILGAFAAFSGVQHVLHPDVLPWSTVLWNLCAGSMLMGVFFFAPDPVTSPTTNGGKIAYGILIGSIMWLLRNFSEHVEGTMFAILIGNMCAPLLDEVSIRMRMRSYEKTMSSINVRG